MEPSAASPDAPEKARVLLVDDKAEHLLALRAILDRPDYDLVCARSGAEALAQILRAEFAVVLLDVVMPGIDGLEAARLIRERPRAQQLPIILLSADADDPEKVARGYAAGAVDFLAKPFDPRVIRSKVAIFVALFRQTRETERRGEALQASERRERELAEALYDVTFEEAPIGIGHADTQGRWLRVNQRMAQLLNLQRDDLREANVADLAHPDDRVRLLEGIAAVLAGKEAHHRGEYRFMRKDGSVAWLVVRLSMLRDRRGAPVALTIIEDVSEQRRLADSLQVSETLFSRLQESGLLGVVFESAAGTLMQANDAFLQLIGHTRDDLERGDIRLSELVPAEYDEVEARAREEIRLQGVCRTYEKELVRKDARRVSVLCGASSTLLPEPGIVCFALDVTERRQAERERGHMLRELRAGVRARDDFLAIAAHELRTPVTPILVGISSLLLTVRKAAEPLAPEWLQRRLAPIDRAAHRLDRLIDTLLDVSRVTVGPMRLELEEVDLCGTVREVADRLRMELERAGCALTVRADGPVLGRWDRLLVEQVVSNLLANALKYGAGHPIEIDVSATDDAARISVLDHGIGIAEDAQARIFERFERLVSVRHYGGFGLGLWIVRQIVESHGGKIEVWSRPGAGSRFTVQLPRIAIRQPAPRLPEVTQ